MKRLLAFLLVLTLLTACAGETFHWRGSKPLPVIAEQGVYLEGVDPLSEFGILLRNALEDTGATVKKADAGDVVKLAILGVSEQRSVSGYSATRQVREFNHVIDVDFRVSGKGLSQPVDRSVHAERSQTYDGQYVLGTAEEEALIKQELRQEAVRLLLLRLQALHL